MTQAVAGMNVPNLHNATSSASLSPEGTADMDLSPAACRSILQELQGAFDVFTRLDKHATGGDIHVFYLSFLYGTAASSDRITATELHGRYELKFTTCHAAYRKCR